MIVALTQSEIQAFLSFHAVRLAEMTKARNSVPASMVKDAIGRLNVFALNYNYQGSQNKMSDIDVTSDEIRILMLRTAERLVESLKGSYGYNPKDELKRLNELSAGLPAHVARSEGDS